MLRGRERADDHALYRLYNAATPAATRMIEALSLSEWLGAAEPRSGSQGAADLVLDIGGGEVGAWVRTARSRVAARLDLLIAPTSGRQRGRTRRWGCTTSAVTCTGLALVGSTLRRCWSGWRPWASSRLRTSACWPSDSLASTRRRRPRERRGPWKPLSLPSPTADGMSIRREITDDLDALLDALPPRSPPDTRSERQQGTARDRAGPRPVAGSPVSRSRGRAPAMDLQMWKPTSTTS
ncbi:MAG: hypothetical protein U0531_02455 [Dehalococcoidia bacterium]